LLEPPAPPARVVPAAAQALPAPEDMPVPAPIPPPVAESFSIVVGTYDNLRDAQRAESALREQKLVPYTIDVLIAPGDLRRRLLLGRYATRDEAEAARVKLGSLSENARVIIGWSERFRVPTPY
jgi:cell division septation protein DedD